MVSHPPPTPQSLAIREAFFLRGIWWTTAGVQEVDKAGAICRGGGIGRETRDGLASNPAASTKPRKAPLIAVSFSLKDVRNRTSFGEKDFLVPLKSKG